MGLNNEVVRDTFVCRAYHWCGVQVWEIGVNPGELQHNFKRRVQNAAQASKRASIAAQGGYKETKQMNSHKREQALVGIHNRQR